MKLSYTKNTVSDFFIQKPNLTKKKKKKKKKNLVVGRGGGGARVSDFFSFFKRIQI